jgi:hypothetical protein
MDGAPKLLSKQSMFGAPSFLCSVNAKFGFGFGKVHAKRKRNCFLENLLHVLYCTVAST